MSIIIAATLLLSIGLSSAYIAFVKELDNESYQAFCYGERHISDEIDSHLSARRYHITRMLRAIVIAVATMMLLGLDMPTWSLLSVSCFTIGFSLSSWHVLLKD